MVKCERQSIDVRALYSDGDGEKRRRPRRQPGMLETSQPGVFTAATC
jgi:hypothetical protein